jgi:hypothetical protein
MLIGDASQVKQRLCTEPRMSQFRQLRHFEQRFDSMSVGELERWKAYWTQHAQLLAPKVRKQAMKRVHKIEKAIQARSRQDDANL